jgi:hypothetical protein
LATKITKSELKQMIREALREELMSKHTLAEAVDDGWYGAYSEVEFDTSVYPDIARYFKLPASCHVVYAFWYMDEVTVEYEGGAGTRYQIEKHVPLGQVEEWFKAGYTIV